MNEQVTHTRLVCLGLAAAVFLVFSYALRCPFIGLDDWPYVVENTRIQVGAWSERLPWILTAIHASNWHPLTLFSHALDVQVFGLNPAGHHLTNLLLHAANTVLLFLLLARMSGALWRGAFVAGVFGLHPLQVESVVWVSSRKGLLATLFAFLALLAYERYRRAPAVRTYLPVCLLLAVSLIAKQSFVVFPALLLLLDWWPLGRFEPGAALRSGPRLLREKIPLILLALAGCAVAMYAQKHGGAVAPLEKWSPLQRLLTGLAGYAGYLDKAIFPRDLSLLYPLPKALPWAKAGLGAGLLLAGIALGWTLRRRAPYVLTGWLWFIVALLPVAGFVQIGNQSMADRYMYVPLIGLALIAAWGVPSALPEFAGKKRLLGLASVLLLALLGVATHLQTLWWGNSIGLYQRSLAVTPDNFFLEHCLALELRSRGDLDGAIEAHRKSIRINPRFTSSQLDLGYLLFTRKRYAEAAELYEKAILQWPENYEFQYNLGASYAQLGRTEEAIAQFERLLAQKPGDEATARNLEILRNQRRTQGKAP
jgi:tetratricopeptide (TPR) repeat protein